MTRQGPHVPDPLVFYAGGVEQCTKCTIASYCNHKVYLRDSHPNWKDHPTVDLLFVGEAPGASEYALRTPFVGPAGSELSEQIYASLDPSLRYVITNAILCTPFTDESRLSIRTPFLPEIGACRSHLQRLIGILKPRHIVALGKIAERSLKKFCPNHKYQPGVLSFVAIAHPAAILRSTHPELDRSRCILTLKSISESLCV